MLNQHNDLLVQQADVLRVGECLVDLPRREVRSPIGTVQRISLKTLQVLLVLARHQGRVVSREALLEWVWPDTLPTDDVLTQAVAQLRKSFGDDRDAPTYLETIAKGGYRLIADIAWIPDRADTSIAGVVTAAEPATAVLPDEPLPGQDTKPKSFLMPAAALGVVLLGLLMFAILPARLRQSSHQEADVATVASPVERITSMPGSEVYPSLSPDGSQVVYSAYDVGGKRADLMVQTRAPVPGRVLVSATPGVRNTMPAWSPDGRQIAFVRLGPKEQCEVRLVDATGGESRPVTRCGAGWEAGVNWSPDNRHLVTTMMGAGAENDGAIYTIDLASGTWTRLNYDKAARDFDGAPVYSPDGKWIAFHRNVSLSDIWRVPAGGGTAEQLTHLGTNIYQIAWSPDSQSLIFGRYRDGGTVLSQLTIADRTVRDLPAGNAAYPSVASRAPIIAFMLIADKSEILSAGLKDPADAGRPIVSVFASTRNELLPAISPDGNRIAFLSDRTGTVRVWVGVVGRPETLRLIDGVEPVARYAPTWSPAGDALLIVGRPVGPATGTQVTNGVYEINVDSGALGRIPIPQSAPVHALYARNGTIMVVADQGAGRLNLTLYQPSGSMWRAVAALPDIAYALLDGARQRVLLTRPTQPGLWQADLALTGMTLINDKLEVGSGRRLFVDNDGIGLLGSDERCASRQFVIDGQTSKPGRCLQQVATAMSVSVDETHQRLYVSVQQPSLSDIGWMTIPKVDVPNTNR